MRPVSQVADLQTLDAFVDLYFSQLAVPFLNASLATIPNNLEDWNIQVIDSLLPILSIEGDTFDFKGNILDKRSEELYNDFCSMSNSLGGIMVLGIREEKAPDGTLLRFVKEGFNTGEEDKVGQKIANGLHNVDPTPTTGIRLVPDINQNKFYPVVKIVMVDTNKPYFTKNRGQCYIRVGNTNQIASRGVILSLQRNLIERMKSVQRFQAAVKFFKESFRTPTSLPLVFTYGDHCLIR